MMQTLSRVEIFDPKGVIVTLPTRKSVSEVRRSIDFRVWYSEPGFGWRYIDPVGNVRTEIINREAGL